MTDKNKSNVFTEAELKSALGSEKWRRLSADKIDAALAITRSEIEAAEIHLIFGPGSSSKQANLVAMNSPVRYALLRQRAVREGLLAI